MSTYLGGLGINDIGFGTQKEVADTLGKINKRRKLTTEENLDVYGPQILQMISNANKVSRRKMALELSISERTIQRVLNSMSSLHFVGGGRNGHWELIERE